MPNIPNGRPFRLQTLLNACLALLMLTAVGSVQAAIPAQERAVLVALYESTHGAGWTNNKGWLGAAGTECSWFGVDCRSTGDGVSVAIAERVISIQLIKNNLIGTLPVTLNNLTALQFFDVDNNQLSGSIPALSGLTKLWGFYVGNNQLSGSIPVLRGLTALQNFHVGNNQLSGSIPVLSGLTALQFFSVIHNQLSGSIPALSGLIALQGFYVGNNQLSGSIPVLSGLTALQNFHVGNNQLSGSIPVLSGLTALQTFHVYNNQLSGSIPALSGLIALQTFHVYNNQLSGSIPVLRGLTALQDFDVASNQLSGSIPVLSGLTALQDFDVASNKLSGTIPVLTGLTALHSFYVFSNQLSGSIPALSGLTALQNFHVGNNQLSGSIPVLSGLTALQDFDVASNKLSGTIPVLTGLTALHSFYVFSNQLSGSIPALSGLTALQNFHVGNNQLSGSIPALSGLTALKYFVVNNNQLSGSIPPAPTSLLAKRSSLCPNQLTPSVDTAWDTATGFTPWSANCKSNTFTVTPSSNANGSISPNSVQTVATGSSTPFTLTPNNGYTTSVAGSCGGKLLGNIYTTNAIIANCTVIASFNAVSTTPPVAAFTVGSGRTALSILVNAAPSTGAGSLASYVWSSADGQTANGKTATFTFTKAGVYDISLTVTDNQGATANLKKQIIVAPVPLLASASYNARNNIPAEALPVLINDSPVQQVFLTPNDVDWYEFYAKAGKNYTIELPKERIGAAINPAVQVYDKSGNALTALITQTAQKQGISVVFNAPSTGLFRLRVSNQPPFARSNAVADNTYQLRILLTDAPLQGIIKGSVISACDLLGIRQADVSAWLAGALTDSTPTHKTGEYGLELNPEQYAIKSIAEQFTPIEQPVTLSQTAISVLNFNQTPAAGCQSVTLPVPDPLLPLPDPLLLLQQQAVAFYNDLTGQLIVRDVWSGNDVYYAELQNVGDYHFQLTRADIIGGTIHAMPGDYGFTPFIANLPNVFAFGKLWTVQLKNQGDWLFTVEKAEE